MASSRLCRAYVAVLLAGLGGLLTQLAPATNVAYAATTDITPKADAWVNGENPAVNYGTFLKLRVATGASEAVLRFRTEGWSGQRVETLTLTLDAVAGNPAALSVDEASNTWSESTVTWLTRPTGIRALDATPSAGPTTVSFDVSGLFPDGVVDRNVVSLLVRNASTDVVMFGARESTTPAVLSLEASAPTAQPEKLLPLADSWADSVHDDKTHGTNRSLYVDGRPRKEAFLSFDLSEWQGRGYSKLQLQLHIGTAGGPGVSVYRVASAWSEASLTWLNRPTGGTLVADVSAEVPSGPMTVDITPAFASGTIEARKLSLRLATTGSTGFDLSSREGDAPPVLELTLKTQPPTPPPTATPTASPTASPTPPPTPSPTASPTAPPTASPTPTPTLIPSPTACPTSAPLFYFEGRGTDHGVGMSQQGARGRAAAGQTYDQILSFYYTGVDFSTVDGSKPIRVLLADDFSPSASQPARVTAYLGQWQSVSFPGVTFPKGSYVELWPPPTPSPSPTPNPISTPMAGTDGAAYAVESFGSPAPLSLSETDTCVESEPALTTVIAPMPQLDVAIKPTSTPTTAPMPNFAVTAPQAPSPTATAVTSLPSPSTSPTATPSGLWVATVYDSVGNVLATTSTNDLVVEAIAPEGVLEMRFRDELPKYQLYRGKIRLLVTGNRLQAINVLPIESYLRGVVPAEVPATWPIEVVKSQAVAARTYAWTRLKGADREWDVVPTAANQVYGGYQHEHPNSDAAVLATRNMVLTYQGKIISALYHACSGGHTENSEYAFVNDKGEPGSRVAYLRGKPDVDENGVPYDIGAGTYDWHSGQFTMAKLSQIMSHNDLTDVGEIYNMTFHRGVSGRVYKVVLEGTKGTKEVSGGKFKNTYNNFRTPGSPNMVSTLFFLTPVAP